MQFIDEAPSLTDLQLERTNVYHDEATNRVAWVQGHYTEAELIDSALDVVRMMRDRIMEHRLTRRQDGEGLHLSSFDLLHHLRASTWAARATLRDAFNEQSSSWST